MKIDGNALQIALDLHDVILFSHLATRPFTECFAGMHTGTAARVFIKVLHSEKPNIRRNFLREVEILKALNGQPGCPVLVAASSHSPLLFHACGYLTAPTFESAFSPPASDSLPAILQSATLLAQWIDSLHQHGYAHRDLSSDHIFMTGAFAISVVDFGMAKSTTGIPRSEAQLYEGYDIQAFGMILWELLCGRPVFSYRGERLAAQIAREVALIRSVGLPPELIRLITRCLSTRSEFVPEGLDSNDPFGSANELQAAMSELLGH